MKKVYILFSILVLLLPSLTMPFFGFQGAESEEAASVLPSLVVDGKVNKDYPSELGDYYAENFGLRREAVTADSAIKAVLFRTSALPEKTVIGQDGYLFMTDTVDDYFGKETLSQEELTRITYNLALLQKTLKADGRKFVFTIAPNKNSLYPEYMPKSYSGSHVNGNAMRLIPLLRSKKIAFVDLFELFDGKDEVYYHKTDSHWTSYGAAMAADALFKKINKKHYDFLDDTYTTRFDFQGDLFGMLYPALTDDEKENYFDHEFSYSYDEKIESTFDPEIHTTNKKADGAVVMFRDSFGNALLPFIAEEYEKGYFTRASQYPAFQAEKMDADAVIFECVERHLYLLKEFAPVIAVHPEKVKLPEKIDEDYKGTLETQDEYNSGYIKVTGEADGAYTDAKTVLYVCAYNFDTEKEKVFPAFRTEDGQPQNKDNGFCTFIDKKYLKPGEYGLSIVTKNGKKITDSQVITDIVIE